MIIEQIELLAEPRHCVKLLSAPRSIQLRSFLESLTADLLGPSGKHMLCGMLTARDKQTDFSVVIKTMAFARCGRCLAVSRRLPSSRLRRWAPAPGGHRGVEFVRSRQRGWLAKASRPRWNWCTST
jgi:hypothetical protein